MRSGGKLAATLAADLELALLFRRIATIELDAPVMGSVDDLRWTGPRPRVRGALRASWTRRVWPSGRTRSRLAVTPWVGCC